MCMQCMTKSVTLKRNIFPGWALVKARETYEDWPAGAYGLLRCNDPDFIFTVKPTKTPSIYSKREKYIPKGYWRWYEEADKFNEELKGSIEASHELYVAAVKAGYKGQDKHGFFSYWLRNYIAKKMRRKSRLKK